MADPRISRFNQSSHGDLMKSAILFLVFNRPQHTQAVFEVLRSQRPPKLYVAADGPRPEKPGEADRCAEVRRIASQVDWPCELHTLFRDDNLGCRRAVSGAISWFFEHEESGIILEDDCLPVPDFFRFCDYALDRWKDDSEVMHVGGHVLLERARPEAMDFSRLVPIWGWATWRRAWRLYDSEMTLLPMLEKLPLRQWFGTQAVNVSKAIHRIHRDRVDAWGARWALTVIANRGLSVLPRVNLISNIGFGADATHTKVDSHVANLPAGSLPSMLTSPRLRDSDPRYDEAYLALMNKKTRIVQRAINRVREALSIAN